MHSHQPLDPLRAEFSRRFGFDLPPEMQGQGLSQAHGGLLLSTHPAELISALEGNDGGRFLAHEPDGHLSVGFWKDQRGREAFCFFSRRAHERIFLYLPMGAAHSSQCRPIDEISDFLPAFVNMLRACRGRKGRMLAIDLMKTGRYVLEHEGRAMEFHSSLVGRTNSIDLMNLLLHGPPAGHGSTCDASTVARQAALDAALRMYCEELRHANGNRAGISALRVAMDVIRDVPTQPSLRAFAHEVQTALAMLCLKYSDPGAQTDHALTCVRRLMQALERPGLAASSGNGCG